MPCPCCGGESDLWWKDTDVILRRCSHCKSLNAAHRGAVKVGDYWNSEQTPDWYLDALGGRRKLQAKKLARWCRLQGVSSPVLDYGTGQGHFVTALRSAAMVAVGCDLAGSSLSRSLPDLLEVKRPWEIPSMDVGTMSLLDVLEHHATPSEFLRQLMADYVLIKVPNARGPLAIASRALRSRWPGPLRGLFLVGDISPHLWYPTRQGLLQLARSAGWDVVFVRSIPEVGIELPDRLRGSAQGQVSSRHSLYVLKFLGLLLQTTGRWWSDSHVLLLRRNVPRAVERSQAPSA